ncbi:uncharacterized protein LOC131246075 [Magnolia sinica]|uniref:uncharacterized protein LOC131246075 n=1 Tax=Magnolia sinica TaxID=86752 RepID=UPI0026592197|nr:uncharacterized protein LOC131246075 [Magnolia sinica]
MRVERDFERTIHSRLPARDTLFRSRQAPPAPLAPAGRFRVQPAGVPPALPRRRCEYCGRDGHTTRFCYKRIAEEGNAPLANCPRQNRAAIRGGPRPQQPRQGPPVEQRAPQARVYVVAATEAELALNTTRMHTPLVVAFPMGKFVATDKICRACPITLANREVAVDLIVMLVRGFDVIFGMDWLTLVRAVMDCRDKTVTISIQGHASFTLKGRGKCQKFESMQALVEAEIVEATIGRIPVVRDFSEVFQEIPGLPTRCAVDFCIDLKLGTALISLPLFCMPPCEMEELRS